jgi:hypothetical protein
MLRDQFVAARQRPLDPVITTPRPGIRSGDGDVFDTSRSDRAGCRPQLVSAKGLNAQAE